jgi:hypothetical protein
MGGKIGALPDFCSWQSTTIAKKKSWKTPPVNLWQQVISDQLVLRGTLRVNQNFRRARELRGNYFLRKSFLRMSGQNS